MQDLAREGLLVLRVYLRRKRQFVGHDFVVFLFADGFAHLFAVKVVFQVIE